MQDPTITAIAWLRARPRRLPLFSIAAVAAGTMLHVAVTAISDVWPATIVVALDLLAALVLLIGGATIALYGVEMAAAAEARRPDVWISPDCISPGPSAENGGRFIVPPEAMGSICIGPPVPLPGFEHTGGTGTARKEYEPAHASPEQRLLDDIFPEVGDNYPVLIAIHEEMLSQADLWGEQNHPNGTGGSTAKMNRTNAKKAVEAAVAAGTLTWADVLKEEFTEAMAEDNPDNLDDELTQVAAVCATWKQALHRQRAAANAEVDPE